MRKNTILGYRSITTGAPEIQADQLPHCLTHEYQQRVAAIGRSDTDNRINKKTGIYCPYEQND